jgi:hypothetical protein
VFFFFLSVCLLGFPVQCVFPCSFSLFRYLPLSFCLRFLAPVPSGFGSCSAPCFFLVSVPCVIGLFVPCSVRKSPLFCLSVFPLFPLCFFPMIFGSIPLPLLLSSALSFIEPQHAENSFPSSSIHERDHGQEIVVSWP